MFGMWRSKREQTRLQRLGQERRVKGLERQVRALAVLQRRGPSITGSYELTRGLRNGVYEGEVLCAPGRCHCGTGGRTSTVLAAALAALIALGAAQQAADRGEFA